MSEHIEPAPGSPETPWEPPFAGTDAEQVVGALERMRWTFRYKADGLDAVGLGTRVGASSLTLGGLLKHLAVNEDHNFFVKMSGAELPEIWADNGWDQDDDWELTSAAKDSPEHLYALYDDAVARARERLAAALAVGGLDQPVHVTGPRGEKVSLRRLVLDMVEEYARHTGHADLLREAVDGRTGEDPPAGWRPTRS